MQSITLCCIFRLPTAMCQRYQPASLPFSDLVDLRCGGVNIMLIYRSFLDALRWITYIFTIPYEKEQEFYSPSRYILTQRKESRLCGVLAWQCWATKPYLSRSCIVLVSCQLRHASVRNRLNPFESVTDEKMRTLGLLFLKESRLCSIFAASMLGNQALTLFLLPVSYYMKAVNNFWLFHLGRLQSNVSEKRNWKVVNLQKMQFFVRWGIWTLDLNESET